MIEAPARPKNQKKSEGTIPMPRRTQTSRRAATSRKIVSATIRCLNRDGYAATSLERVIIEAGISRGRLLHIFPTKVDLMIAVGRYVWSLDKRYYRITLLNRRAGPATEFEMLDKGWLAMSRPSGVAVLEILVACRSDPALAEQFVPEHRRIQEESALATATMLGNLGIPASVSAHAFHHFVEACIRGLVIDRSFASSGSAIPPALELAKFAIRRILKGAD